MVMSDMFIKPSNGRITSPYGPRTHPVTGQKNVMHWGVDYGRDAGTRIVAAADGKVVRARNEITDGYGKYVRIEHKINGKVYNSLYAHLASISVKEGQTVTQGQSIGVMGNTGVGTGVHLHFEITVGTWNNKFTTNVNPLHYVVDPQIKIVQQLLVEKGYNLKVDGIAGHATDKAIKDFQAKNGLTVDGIAWTATLDALNKKEVVAVSDKDDGRLARASESHREAQEYVKQHGISNGEYPAKTITREQVWTMLMRLDRMIAERNK